MTTKTTSPAEKSHQNLVDARTTLQDRKAELSSIASEIESIDRAWQAGDDTIPASRMSELEMEQTRLASLVAAAEKQVKITERLLLTDDPELARAVAFALGSSFHGIEAEAVTKLPQHDEDDLRPHLYVVQPKPHQESGDGSVSGECTIQLVGPAWTAPLDASNVHRTLREAGTRWKGDLNVSNNRISLNVNSSQPMIPTIRSIPDTRGSHVNVSDIKAVIERGCGDGRVTLAEASAPAGEIVSVSVDGEGIRTTLIETSLTIRNNPRGYWSADQAVEQAKKELSGLRGKCLGVLGRVSHVEHNSVTVTEAELTSGPGRRLTSRFTTISKVAA